MKLGVGERGRGVDARKVCGEGGTSRFRSLIIFMVLGASITAFLFGHRVGFSVGHLLEWMCLFVSLVCRVSLLEVFPGRDSCEMEVGCVVGEWKRLAWGREVNTAATDDECHSPS